MLYRTDLLCPSIAVLWPLIMVFNPSINPRANSLVNSAIVGDGVNAVT
ncbi:hypothetical protein [Vulcanisaeta souniana]|nr:hypothetical protein [Vulcanisaeta souniana]